MIIAIGNDHTAVELKTIIKHYLEEKGHNVIDVGTNSTDSCDYPIFAKKVCDEIVSGHCEKGILICGTGLGVSIAANKVNGIRAACVSEPISAAFASEHNNANVICFGARIVGTEVAKAIVDSYLSTPYAGGRHQRRLDEIKELEEENKK